MGMPEVVSRADWLEARQRLLEMEKDDTRRRGRLAAARRELPMVKVDKEYVLAGAHGPARLADLFDGCDQLIIKHVMFAPQWEAACPGCTASTDAVNDRVLAHLRSRDTAFALVSAAPVDKLLKYQADRGWPMPWYSAQGTDFNHDFQVTIDQPAGQVYYNYRCVADELADGEVREMNGLSCFLRHDGDVYHTYSTYGRGAESLIPAYALLDLTAYGRSEAWEEPRGRTRSVRRPDPTFTS